MTWSIYLSGHHQDAEGKWDAESEKEISDILVESNLLEKLRERGLTAANFTGNHFYRNYLTESEETDTNG